ncbi:SusC/RagA family TonB-linked outer membrane protein [Proteiniphilum sp. UBA5384]|uniref:SusC/RagA family TonB-linked outer membrane protein n=1 Tax=Proteiniphilum sp. UBA5384 TaxID=1947279 RepID=UPI0025EF699A|nr:SusC/RagA family TonB-linked outer membrane protein [Proteiniphilum sp. UBA5384]
MNFNLIINAKAKIFFLFFCLISIQTIAYAQNNATITLTSKSISVIDALREIEKQSKLSIAFNESQLADKKATNLNVKNGSVEEALTSVLRGSGFTYRIKDGYVVIISDTAPPSAQKKITGQVLDENDEPMIGVTVIVEGDPSTGTATNIDGNFTLQVEDGAVLNISYIGYDTRKVTITGQNSYTIHLIPDTQLLSEVVVTALGIKRSEKALSYNVQQIAGNDLVGIKDANFINSLSGKIAGLNINSSSSGIGGASKVVMRGTKSIEQTSNALYVIDGVPMYNFSGGGETVFGSKGSSEGIADINPEDIENISVLTGAAAAALYGSDAANGAIVITTKSGQSGKTLISVSSNMEMMNPFILPKFQNRYGTSDQYLSWGSRLNASNFMGYDPKKDYFQRGMAATESVSLSTGTEKNQTYLSASAVNSIGIIPNNKYNRYNFTFRNSTAFYDDQVKLDVGASYIRQDDRNMTNQGIYLNPLTSAYLFPRGNDWEDIRMYERYNPSRKINEQYWPSGAATYVMQNPYWINYRNLRENKKDRYMANAGLTYFINDWINISARIRMDHSGNDYTEKLYASTNTLMTEGSPNGFYGFTRSVDKQMYGDILLNINKELRDELTFQFNGGVSFSDMRSDAFLNRGPIAYGLGVAEGVNEPVGIPNVFNIFQLSDTQTLREQNGWREKTNSIFGSAELGYKSTYYLTLTGRNDWPSQLAGPNSKSRSFFYPSVGGSAVISEIVDLPKQISYMKVRASWASVGLPFRRFLANPTYSWDAGNKVWITKTHYPLYNLKPERTNSWEFGLDTRFLKGFNFDFTYYYANTYNQTFNPKLSVSSGWSDIFIQTGSVLNQGIELGLGYKNQWNKFSWSSYYTLSMNRNRILDLADDAINPITGEKFSIEHLDVGGLGQTRFILKKKGGLGDIYSTTDLARDSKGNIYIDENGSIQSTKINQLEDYIKLGSVFPKSNMGWKNDFKYGNFSLGFLLSARFGGVVFSRTQAAMDYYGVSEASAKARDNGGVIINGGDHISAEKWYTTIGSGDAVAPYYIYDATNIRLQEASIGYNFPRAWFRGVADMTLSLTGRNLWMIYCKAPFDPESVASTENYYQGMDYFMTPATRSFGLNLRVTF